jgi:hypothetical protein
MPLCRKLLITQPAYTETLRYTLLFRKNCIVDSQNRHTIPPMPSRQPTLTSKTGAATIGTLGAGALAIGALAIRKLAIGKARVKELHIDRLTIGQLEVDVQDVQSTRTADTS